MGINLSPISARSASVGGADDPFKKYWWAILAGFAATGVWMFAPMMGTQIGSVRVDTAPKPAVDASAVEQNLDSAANPSGAPGGALDLSMDGLKRKSREDEATASMLYQAPPEAGVAAAAGAPLGTATASSSASLAQQLKEAGKAKGAGGWSEKAQSGFSAPHLGGSGLSGVGSAGGSSSASAGGAGSFGFHNAQTGSASTVGLRDDGSANAAGPAGFQALRNSAAAGGPGLGGLKGSAEGVHASMSGVFDGAKGKGNAIGGDPANAMASARSAYDAAPANLKANDPQLNSTQLPTPPMATPPAASGSNMGQQLAMMAATALIGGMIPGVGGQMVMMMGMMMMQQQQQQQAAASAAAQQNTVYNRYGHP